MGLPDYMRKRAWVAVILTFVLGIAAAGPQDQALLDMYNSMNGIGWISQTGWPIGDKCTWQNVNCDTNLDVTSLYLSANGLTGAIPTNLSANAISSIPNQFSQLVTLSQLHLGGNFLSQDINVFRQLTFLTKLEVYGNSLTGTLTAMTLLTNLQYLDFSRNSISGDLSLLSPLGGLSYLYGGYNSISGGLSALTQWLAIEELSMPYNSFTVGALPATLTMLSKVDCVVDISGNSVVGTIPSSYSTWPSVGYLYMNAMGLTGTLVTPLSVNVKALEFSDNALTGAMPFLFSILTSLTSVRLKGNAISEQLTKFQFMTGLERLDIASNLFSGLVTQLAGLTNLMHLDIRLNAVTGDISELDPLTKLSALYFGTQQPITGDFSRLSRWTNITTLVGSSAALSGTLPDLLTSLSRLGLTLDIGNNAAAGSIPAVFASWTNVASLSINSMGLTGGFQMPISSNLQSFDASSNFLTGPLPVAFTQLTRLQVLKLSSNNLAGALPILPVTLKSLDIAANRFSGGLPSLTDLVQLQLFDIHQNEFSGSLSSLTALTVLKKLNVANNNFTGLLPDVPPAIGSMNFASCLFSGTIPVGHFAAVAVQFYSVESNQLTGSLPAQYSNLINVQSFLVGQNSLTGALGSFQPLTALNSVVLRTNRFSGSMPNIATSVAYLDFSGNSFIGSIPINHMAATNLVHYWIAQNSLSGSLPASITDLHALTTLNIAVNALTGPLVLPVPALVEVLGYANQFNQAIDAAHLTGNANLIKIWLGGCQLNGSLPDMPLSMRSFDLSFNRFVGTVPLAHTGMTNLQLYKIQNNLLTGALPLFSASLTALTVFNVQFNSLTGVIQVPNAVNVQELDFHSNMFTVAPASTDLVAFTALVKLDISMNLLTGSMPYLPLSLKTFVAAQNAFNGIIPGQHGVLTKLLSYDVGSNALTGSIPLLFSTMTEMSYLVLRTNLLNGALVIPASPNLRTLWVNYNSMTGTLPATLFASTLFTGLNQINIASNSFSGSLPGFPTSLAAFQANSNAFTGTIPLQHASATALTAYYIGSNQLTGSIPTEFSLLSKMASFRCEFNTLTGNVVIPNAPTAMTYLMLYRNQLSGTFPTYMSLLSRLSEMSAQQNLISGSLFNLGTAVASLELTGNLLTGVLPPQWTAAASIYGIRLAGNQLSGTIPAVWTQFAQLQALRLESNLLSGSVVVGPGMNMLREMSLSNNSISGTFPVAFTSLLSVSYLDFSNNSISGSYPAGMTAVTGLALLNLRSNLMTGAFELHALQTRLSQLDLQYNSFSGTLPAALATITALRTVLLNDNAFIGAIPLSVSNAAMQLWNAARNQLSGSIPSDISALVACKEFSLDSNTAVTGPIPPLVTLMTALTTFGLANMQLTGMFPFAGALFNMRYLRLQNNQLSGTLPLQFSVMSNLLHVDMSHNQISGSIPLAVLMTKLTYFNAASNMFGGPLFLPTALELVHYDLSANAFTGIIPLVVTQLTKLQHFAVASNLLTGVVPFTSGAHNALTHLSFSNNSIAGNWPVHMSTLTALRVLRVSHNLLTGTLPAGMSALVDLQTLDLCYNNLSLAAFPSYWSSIANRCLIGNLFDGTECPTDACSPCPLGTSFASLGVTKSPTSCSQCLAGTYTNSSGVNACLDCPVSTFRNISGGAYASDCWPCVQGAFCNTSRLIQPHLCPAGSASAAIGASSSATCVTCDYGKYSNSPGLAACINCPVGSGTIIVGATHMSSCLVPTISSVYPDSGPIAGGTIVTIRGTLGAGSDIVSVTLNGVAASIGAQTTQSVTVTAAPGSLSGLGTVVVQSTSLSLSSYTNGWTYNAVGVIVSAVPSNGPAAGAMTVTIQGTGLGNGSDVTAVLFDGVSASIQSQTATSVTVLNPSGFGTVSVTVQSVAFGNCVQAAVFTYNPAMVVIGIMPSSLPVSATIRVITLFGTNLAYPGLTVTFASGTTANITSQAATSIVVTLPAPSAPHIGVFTLSSALAGVVVTSQTFAYMGEAVMLSTLFTQVEGTDLVLQVQLSSPPSTATSFSLSSSCLYSTLLTPVIMFNSTTWNVNQSIVLQAQRNYIVTGGQSCNVTLLPAVSGDVLYAGITALYAIFYVDVDVLGIRYGNGTLSSAGADLQMLEGSSGNFTLVMTSKPNANVQITVQSSNNARLIVDMGIVVFTPLNWNVTQAIVLRAPQDFTATGAVWVTVMLQLTTSDLQYAAYAATGPNVLLLDLDAAGAVQFSPAVRNTTEWGAIVELFAVLGRSVTSNVVVTATSSDTSVASVSPSSVVIAAADLYKPYSFSVVGFRDDIAREDQRFSILFTAQGTAVMHSEAVVMYNTNVDVAGFNISRTALVVNETGTTDTFTVIPTSKPVTTLVLALSVQHPLVVALNSNLTVWTSSTWQLPRVVTVTGLRYADDSDTTDRRTNVTLAVASGDAVYMQLARSVVDVISYDIRCPLHALFQRHCYRKLGAKLPLWEISYQA
eukprot:TRINITY_DN1908_c0_g2_i1.p1 TRINITY_DN1908_c0_g2~~TRINITY_DN1908_c0_g2_i1.p1  ORF type:complete len:2463 (-),score=602.58 TRINITY_DN1908_c0_g2_i1:5194-12582(-)